MHKRLDQIVTEDLWAINVKKKHETRTKEVETDVPAPEFL